MKAAACTKSFGGRTVLRCPALTFEPSRIYALIGANGSGKSTYARLLAGVLSPDGGGRVLDSRANVRYMPQKNYAFRMSALSNILLAGGDRERARELMQKLQLEALAPRRATALSGGESARMALARILMQPCELLIADEPTAAMDMESAAVSEELLRSYCAETAAAVLLITHDLHQARRLADEALFFSGGELLEAGSAERVLYRPEREETRRFLAFYAGDGRDNIS